MKEKKYLVWQGNISENGGGDYNFEGVFGTFEKAKEHFERIKENTEGYSKKPHGFIETYIEKIDNDEDEEEEYYINVVDSYKFYY